MENVLNYFRSLKPDTVKTIDNKDVLHQISELNHYDRKQLRESLLQDSLRFKSNKEAVEWLQGCFDIIDKHTFRIHKVLFSPGTDIGNTLNDLLNKAKKSVLLCVFSITDHRLAKDIWECHKRGVQVKVITDDRKIFDRGSEIQNLRNKGIDIKIDHSEYHMHNKFGIIDDRIAFTGSFNWTYTAQKHNQENLLVTTNQSIVEQFKSEFDRLWQEMFKL